MDTPLVSKQQDLLGGSELEDVCRMIWGVCGLVYESTNGDNSIHEQLQ